MLPGIVTHGSRPCQSTRAANPAKTCLHTPPISSQQQSTSKNSINIPGQKTTNQAILRAIDFAWENR